jgi:hypothetical protein
MLLRGSRLDQAARQRPWLGRGWRRRGVWFWRVLTDTLQHEMGHVRPGVEQSMDAPPERGSSSVVLRAIPDQAGAGP